jgi:hypothetical protein
MTLDALRAIRTDITRIAETPTDDLTVDQIVQALGTIEKVRADSERHEFDADASARALITYGVLVHRKSLEIKLAIKEES